MTYARALQCAAGAEHRRRDRGKTAGIGSKHIVAGMQRVAGQHIERRQASRRPDETINL